MRVISNNTYPNVSIVFQRADTIVVGYDITFSVRERINYSGKSTETCEHAIVENILQTVSEVSDVLFKTNAPAKVYAYHKSLERLLKFIAIPSSENLARFENYGGIQELIRLKRGIYSAEND